MTVTAGSGRGVVVRRALVGVFVTALAMISAAPAVAANQDVQVRDDVFMPSAVAVKPGESVTWINPGPSGGSSDRHNVHFEDEKFEDPTPAPTIGPWTTTRTFSTSEAGAFRFFCEEHGNFGGSGMAGTVFVNAAGTFPGAQPVASFTVSPSPAQAGQTVTFDGSASTDSDGTIVKYEWDLDNNGTFEKDNSSSKTVSQVYNRAGTLDVKLRVTDNQGVTGETTRSLKINAAPVSSFTVSPSSAQTGQTVTFDGSASTDSDGTIAKYEWDLDGDGTFETNTGTTPTTSRSYATAATLSVKLRVTDNNGGLAETTRPLQINAPAQPPPPASGGQLLPPPIPAAALPPAPVKCSSLAGAKRAACVQRTTCSKLKGSKRASCIQRSCRSIKASQRGPCLRKSCRFLKRSQRAACMRKSCSTLKGAKKRACLRKYPARSRKS